MRGKHLSRCPSQPDLASVQGVSMLWRQIRWASHVSSHVNHESSGLGQLELVCFVIIAAVATGKTSMLAKSEDLSHSDETTF